MNNLLKTIVMKKLFFAVALTVLQICAFGQTPIKFLGIPVDGYKADMIKALESKGYVYDSEIDILKGEFNGEDVIITIQTNNNKIWRIVIADIMPRSETNITQRFNILYDQFMRNGKYELISGRPINEGEDISYNISVNGKRYEAAFVPYDKSINGGVWFCIAESLGQYIIAMYYENFDNKANGEDL